MPRVHPDRVGSRHWESHAYAHGVSRLDAAGVDLHHLTLDAALQDDALTSSNVPVFHVSPYPTGAAHLHGTRHPFPLPKSHLKMPPIRSV